MSSNVTVLACLNKTWVEEVLSVKGDVGLRYSSRSWCQACVTCMLSVSTCQIDVRERCSVMWHTSTPCDATHSLGRPHAQHLQAMRFSCLQRKLKKKHQIPKKHVCWQCPQDLLLSTATVLFRWKQILRMCHVFNVWSQIERAQFKGAKNGVTTGGSLLDFFAVAQWRENAASMKNCCQFKNNNCCKMLQVNKRIKRWMLWALKTQ